MDKIYQLKAYLQYRTRSRTKFSVHSPFLFEFCTEIMDDHTHYAAYQIPEKLKRTLLKSTQVIEVQDFGTGADKASLRTVGSIAKNSSQRKKYGRLLFRIARYYPFKSIIELGTSLGITTSYFALAKQDVNVLTIEGSESIHKIARQNFKENHLQNVISLKGKFEDLFEEIMTGNCHATLIFIDGNHAYHPTLHYYQIAKSKIDSGSMVIIDDIHGSQEMENAWNEIIKDDLVRMSIDLFQFGILVFREGLSKENFILR